MELINSSDLFSTPEAIFLSDLLIPLINPCNLQKVKVHFSDEEVKDNGKNDLKYLNLVNKTPQNCKLNRGKYPKEHKNNN